MINMYFELCEKQFSLTSFQFLESERENVFGHMLHIKLVIGVGFRPSIFLYLAVSLGNYVLIPWSCKD